jgi:phosphate-selective porin OprO/OprP
LFGGKQRYDVSQSEFTQPTRGKSWGDVELMVRYDYLNLNSEDINPGSLTRGGSGQNYALGIVYHVNNNVKMMLNYHYAQNDRYANNKNKACIGLDKNGKPTSSPLAVSEEMSDVIGVRFNALQFRIEIDF